MRFLLLLSCLLLTACATEVGRDGSRETRFDPKYLAKTEIDRVTDANRREVVAGLMILADKLYRRNPREWKKSAGTREAALERLRQRQTLPSELEGKREGPAAMLAFREDYAGDRVAALMFGLLTMVDAAFEFKEEFYMLDSVDERKLNNCARNFEIAAWKLGSTKAATGELLILSNELEAATRNLSFEREFGRLIGLLDFMANLVADRHGRGLTRASQSMATAVFLPVGLLR